MRITRIESFCTEWVGFVRVTADDGTQGWGQVSTYNADITQAVLHRQVAPHVLGQDTTDLDDLVDRVLDGCVTVGDQPGWGVDIHPEWLARASYRVSEGELAPRHRGGADAAAG